MRFIKKITNLPGDILEFGVYKGISLVRLLSFRKLLENDYSRKVTGFDMFGKFPDNELHLDSDRKFVERFENSGGYGIAASELDMHLKRKEFTNYSLIEGDILKTLPEFVEQNPQIKISLLHIDVDVYEPTKIILETLWDKLVKGGIVMLDDYGTVEGETKAADEFVSQIGNLYIQKLPYNFTPCYIIK